jgi:DNA-binding NtrC family response regulator
MDQPSTHPVDAPASARIVFASGASMKALDAMASEIARTALSVLVIGESGTSKDTYARLIHSLSRSNDGPFRKINRTVLDPERLSSQVTEATKNLAAYLLGGTLYLDNVQELDLTGQRALFSQLSDNESAMQGQGRCCP